MEEEQEEEEEEEEEDEEKHIESTAKIQDQKCIILTVFGTVRTSVVRLKEQSAFTGHSAKLPHLSYQAL